jgi:hypothetical protein
VELFCDLKFDYRSGKIGLVAFAEVHLGFGGK